jgi:release factor glutamine methyltransferase
MDIDSYLRQATATLKSSGIESARLDSLILIEDAIAKDRSWLLAHPEYLLPDPIVDELNKKVIQRKTHIPLAYIRGHNEFYGRKFTVNQHVLDPRPETETMVEMLLQLELGDRPTIVDVGTGSGVLAITTKLEVPGAHVYGIDIDQYCLDTATDNATDLNADVTWLKGDLLHTSNLPTDIAVVLANLPYVPDSYPINTAARHEPGLALFGGNDGLDLFRTMFNQLQTSRARIVLTECLLDQHQALQAIAEDAGYKLTSSTDLIQQFEAR